MQIHVILHHYITLPSEYCGTSGCVLAQQTSTLVWTRCSAAGNLGLRNVVRDSLNFTDDAAIFAETTEDLSEAIESLSEEEEPGVLRVSWIKTKVQTIVHSLDAII